LPTVSKTISALSESYLNSSSPSLTLLGFDLSSAYDMIIPKHGKGIVKTDLAIAIPFGTYARIGE
jgi:dUTP pyrophosphatase